MSYKNTLKTCLILLMPILFMGSGAFAAIDFSFGFGHGGYYKGGKHYKHGYGYRPYYHRGYNRGYYRPRQVIYYNTSSTQYNYQMPSNLVSMKNRQYNDLENVDRMGTLGNNELADMRNRLYDLNNQFLEHYGKYESALGNRDTSQDYRRSTENRMVDLNNQFVDQYRKFRDMHSSLR